MANGLNGHERDGSGRFTPGNQAARGRTHPHAARVAELRSAMLEAITPESIRKAVLALIAEAERGNIVAVRELLDRAVGRPLEPDLMQRISDLEAQREALQ